ncbi:MAG: hypothetical protein WDM77_03625 [Steroidobacteraceae bacterium]
MREAYAADPVARDLDIRSVACRKTGCELQYIDTRPPADLHTLPAWIQVVQHIRKSELGAAIEMGANFGSRYGDREMYLTTFTRRPGRRDEPR